MNYSITRLPNYQITQLPDYPIPLSSAFVSSDVVARRRPRVDLSGPRDFLLRIEQHFFPLCDPASRARDGEEHREHLDREAHRLIDQPRIEVDVRIELAAHEVLVLQGNALQL